MKDMIKRIREEKGGFTLAELLIVVAIILVLVAVAVPVFTGALGKANEAVENANQRSVRSEAAAMYLLATDDAKYNALPKTFCIDEQGNLTSGDTAPTGKYKEYTVTYPTAPSASSDNINNVVITVSTGVEKGQ